MTAATTPAAAIRRSKTRVLAGPTQLIVAAFLTEPPIRPQVSPAAREDLQLRIDQIGRFGGP